MVYEVFASYFQIIYLPINDLTVCPDGIYFILRISWVLQRSGAAASDAAAATQPSAPPWSADVDAEGSSDGGRSALHNAVGLVIRVD